MAGRRALTCRIDVLRYDSASNDPAPPIIDNTSLAMAGMGFQMPYTYYDACIRELNAYLECFESRPVRMDRLIDGFGGSLNEKEFFDLFGRQPQSARELYDTLSSTGRRQKEGRFPFIGTRKGVLSGHLYMSTKLTRCRRLPVHVGACYRAWTGV